MFSVLYMYVLICSYFISGFVLAREAKIMYNTFLILLLSIITMYKVVCFQKVFYL